MTRLEGDLGGKLHWLAGTIATDFVLNAGRALYRQTLRASITSSFHSAADYDSYDC